MFISHPFIIGDNISTLRAERGFMHWLLQTWRPYGPHLGLCIGCYKRNDPTGRHSTHAETPRFQPIPARRVGMFITQRPTIGDNISTLRAEREFAHRLLQT